MRGMLWHNNPNLDINTNVDDAINAFRKKFGYRPRLVVARVEDTNKMRVRMDVDVIAKSAVQQGHIIVYEVVTARTPVKFDGERTPVQ